MPCERRPIPKNRGGARSDRADSGRHPGENALFSSQRGLAGSVLDMWWPLYHGNIRIDHSSIFFEEHQILTSHHELLGVWLPPVNHILSSKLKIFILKPRKTNAPTEEMVDCDDFLCLFFHSSCTANALHVNKQVLYIHHSILNIETILSHQNYHSSFHHGSCFLYSQLKSRSSKSECLVVINLLAIAYGFVSTKFLLKNKFEFKIMIVIISVTVIVILIILLPMYSCSIIHCNNNAAFLILSFLNVKEWKE